MKHFIVTLLVGLSLTGCSLMPWSSDDDSEVLTFLPADQLNQWDLTAKFSVSTKEGTESGSIRWILNPDEERLDVLSPTGSVVAQLTMTESEARLKTDDRETVAKDAETLFREVMDLSLPVAALRYWVRGLDAPDLPLESVEKDGEGRITVLTQDGWQLAYNGNVSIESGSHRFEVPRRLTATRGDIEIRWASTEWQAITQ
ncbi:MAG: outer membrane lipoprotein LolB [Gammaproteobacteria bacterium]|nr:outer membrane lipoprotein LolB [Gammaproteobacteria bacterium]OUX77441.1 MAG: outer membrane lipoprotein LolB [Oceanospirillales bacterium TMED59]